MSLTWSHSGRWSVFLGQPGCGGGEVSQSVSAINRKEKGSPEPACVNGCRRGEILVAGVAGSRFYLRVPSASGP